VQDGALWKCPHQFLAAISHWCDIQASKRRARYVVAAGVLLAVVGCAWPSAEVALGFSSDGNRPD
jgi:hypothetical protein